MRQTFCEFVQTGHVNIFFSILAIASASFFRAMIVAPQVQDAVNNQERQIAFVILSALDRFRDRDRWGDKDIAQFTLFGERKRQHVGGLSFPRYSRLSRRISPAFTKITATPSRGRANARAVFLAHPPTHDSLIPASLAATTRTAILRLGRADRPQGEALQKRFVGGAELERGLVVVAVSQGVKLAISRIDISGKAIRRTQSVIALQRFKPQDVGSARAGRHGQYHSTSD